MNKNLVMAWLGCLIALITLYFFTLAQAQHTQDFDAFHTINRVTALYLGISHAIVGCMWASDNCADTRAVRDFIRVTAYALLVVPFSAEPAYWPMLIVAVYSAWVIHFMPSPD